MKRVTLEQVISASQNLGANAFIVQITNPKFPLQTAHTEHFYANSMLYTHDYKQDKLRRIASRYSTAFKKAWFYVSDEIFIKYF